jgi:hypothetical protein
MQRAPDALPRRACTACAARCAPLLLHVSNVRYSVCLRIALTLRSWLMEMSDKTGGLEFRSANNFDRSSVDRLLAVWLSSAPAVTTALALARC